MSTLQGCPKDWPSLPSMMCFGVRLRYHRFDAGKRMDFQSAAKATCLDEIGVSRWPVSPAKRHQFRDGYNLERVSPRVQPPGGAAPSFLGLRECSAS